MQEMLRLGLVFDLPVPRRAILEICSHIPECENYINRAIALGLLEYSFDQSLRVPRILFVGSSEIPSSPLLPFNQAAQILHRLWYVEAEISTEEQRLEIHRLALTGKETEIAAQMTDTLTGRWIGQSRFREASHLCKSTLEITQDYRVLHQLARSQAELGEVEQAKHHYQQALDNCLKSPDAQVVREIIARVQRMMEDRDKGREGNPKKENTSQSLRHPITLSPFLIIAAIVLLAVGGLFAFKLQRSGFTQNRPNQTLLPK